jgi:GDPmannose 4,6-dehydratase
MMSKRILITGITGQDGSYLTDYFISLGYEVHGIIRRSSSFNTDRIDHLMSNEEIYNKKLFLKYGDLTDYGSTVTIIRDVDPDEIYHLGAQTHVQVSFEMPIFTGNVTGLGTTAILEAIRKTESECKFYQASSSEMFGSALPPQSEDTKFHPRSPYAVSKVYAYWMTVNYRESYGIHASNGILFNHESPRRGGTFVTKKIIDAVSRIKKGTQKTLYLGNLNAQRDWGYAPEFVLGMKKILDYKEPGDFVLGTGVSYSVNDFLNAAFEYAGLERADHVKIDPRYFRPSEVDHLKADITKSKERLNWNPKILAMDLVKIMMDYGFKYEGLEPIGEGIDIVNKLNLDWAL